MKIYSFQPPLFGGIGVQMEATSSLEIQDWLENIGNISDY